MLPGESLAFGSWMKFLPFHFCISAHKISILLETSISCHLQNLDPSPFNNARLFCWVCLLWSPSFFPVEREHQWWMKKVSDIIYYTNFSSALAVTEQCPRKNMNLASFTPETEQLLQDKKILSPCFQSPHSLVLPCVSQIKKRHEFTFWGVCSTS